MHFLHSIHRFCSNAKNAFASKARILPPTRAGTYRYIDPKAFAIEDSSKILQTLGANQSLLKINRVVSDKMVTIIDSQMVQGMAKGTLTREEWDKKYMKADALYIYQLGCSLAERAAKETEKDRTHMMELAEMFLGYGKHFERLKKYGLSSADMLMSRECDEHIAFLSKETSINEFYVAILEEYARKYGDLNNHYAKDKLGKTIKIVNEILVKRKIDNNTAESIFQNGFTFEDWFIRNAFSDGFNIKPLTRIERS